MARENGAFYSSALCHELRATGDIPILSGGFCSQLVRMSNSSEFEVVTGVEDARPFRASLRTTGQCVLFMAEIDVYIIALAFLQGDLSTLYQVVLVFLVGSLVCSLVCFGVAYLAHQKMRHEMFPRHVTFDPQTDMVTMITPHDTLEFSVDGTRWAIGSTLQETHGEFLARSQAILLEVGKQENNLPHIVSLPEGRVATKWKQVLERKGVQNLRPYRSGESILLPPTWVRATCFGGFVGLTLAWGTCEAWVAAIGPPPRPEVIYWLFLLLGICVGYVLGSKEDIVETPLVPNALGFIAFFLSFGIPLAIRADGNITKVFVAAAFIGASLICIALLLIRRWQYRRRSRW